MRATRAVERHRADIRAVAARSTRVADYNRAHEVAKARAHAHGGVEGCLFRALPEDLRGALPRSVLLFSDAAANDTSLVMAPERESRASLPR